jgi:GNAT superfamily N-acetyltransferase
MTSMGIEIKSLSASLLDDYLDYFDHTAFADNPDWAGCYCYFYLADESEQDWETRTAEQNRRAVGDLIAGGRMYGYLAYVDGKVAGWCHAGPKAYFPGLMADRDLAEPDVAQTGSIVCFNVAPAERRRGIAGALLEAACQGLAALGLKVAEAYPRPEVSGDAAHYHGPLQMYLRAGFEIHRECPTYQIVRRAL